MENGVVPFSAIFHRMGYNALHSVTDTWGVYYIAAGVSTYAFVQSGADWAWNRLAYRNPALIYAGLPAGFIGFILPFVLPVSLYLYGRRERLPETQIAGLAMGQAAALALGISSGMKVFTGRRPPELVRGGFFKANRQDAPDDYSADFAFGFARRGAFNGWPSSHTAVAFAMAAALSELYPSSVKIKAFSYGYAAFTGLGMSLFGHWASESVAGALIGYAIGKSVGSDFKQMRGQNAGSAGAVAALPGITIGKNLSFFPAPNCVLICARL